MNGSAIYLWIIIVVMPLGLISCGPTSPGPDPEPARQNSSIEKTTTLEGGSVKPEEVGAHSQGMTPEQIEGLSGAPEEASSYPLPDLSLMSEASFQRNAKMGRLVARQRCILCHKIEGRGAILQPPLIQVSMRRLDRMKTYDSHLDQLRTSDPDRYSSKKDLFEKITAEADVLRKMQLWLGGYLRRPTFDNSQAKMPLQVLKPVEVDQLACYVIQLAIEGYQQGEAPLED